MIRRFMVEGHGTVPVTGFSATAEQAGERAALYLRSGWARITITDMEALT